MSSTSYRRRLTSVSSILTAALALVEKGWTQYMDHRVVDGTQHQFCSRGAIQAVSRTWQQAAAAEEMFTSAGRISSIVGFNDRPSTTKRQIVSKFRKAIARASR